MDRIKFVPSRLRRAIGIDSDSFINLSFESTTKPINEYLITNIVNQQDLFDEERSINGSYRFSGKINIYTANELTPIDDENIINRAFDEDWDPLFDGNPQVTPNNWLLQLVYPHTKSYEYNIIHYIPTDQGVINIQSKADKGPQIKKMGLANPVSTEEKVYINGVQKHNLNIDDLNSKLKKIGSELTNWGDTKFDKTEKYTEAKELVREAKEMVDSKVTINGIDIEVAYSNYQKEQKNLIEEEKAY
jgi:hypothetical protein